jgi:outer membrane lipoprotein-sorting protein
MILRILLIVLMLFVPCKAMNQEEKLPLEILEQLHELHSTTKTVSGGFIQEKHLAMFARPLVSRGTFAIAQPDKIHWAYEEPMSLGFASDGTKVRRWDEHSGMTQSKSLATDPILSVIVDQMLAWSTMNAPAMERHFALSLDSSDPVILHLEPNAVQLREIISHVRITFTPDQTHLGQITVVEPDGDKTIIYFINVKLNVELAGDLF